MFSYHPSPADAAHPERYAFGFKTAAVSLPRLARAAASHVWSGIVWEGGRRQQSAFLFSDYCVLDIDEGGEALPLAQAIRQFCDMVHIIGTTKSHQKLKNHIVGDRYRVIFPWERRITSLRTYRWNMQMMRDRYPLDRKALDGARYFFPCTEIVSLSEDGYRAEVNETIPDDFESYECSDYRLLCAIRTKKHRVAGQLKPWVRDFLAHGKTIGDGRNYTVFRASIALFECGYALSEVVAAISGAPFPRADFSECEIVDTATKALKRFQADGGCYDHG